MPVNPLSMFGRMNYMTHMLVYPGAIAFYVYVVAPYRKASDAASL